MPLTPLGRQLRSVLVNLRVATQDGSIRPLRGPKRTFSTHSIRTRPSVLSVHTRPYHHARAEKHSAATALLIGEEPSFDWSASVIFDADEDRNEVWEQAGWGRRVNVGQASRGYGSTNEAFNEPAETIATTPTSQPVVSTIPVLEQTAGEDITLETILSRFTHHWETAVSGRADWDRSCCLNDQESECLARAGYARDDVEQWAKILSTPASLDAASALQSRHQAPEQHATPILVLSALLRRNYISATALRLLLKQTEMALQVHTGDDCTLDRIVFDTFLHLFRHARKVCPPALDHVARILLEHLTPLQHDDTGPDFEQLQRLTHTLNKVMRLVVIPAAIHPIKSNLHQEAALVRVLKFMTSHKPTLQISREGYRAVVLLQLAQRKTASEQQWAEIKALSWPPWKEERTAMDGFITADEHGVSKAAETLIRMREAGYGPLAWEETAMLYAGWDTDRTPTIQTLALLGMNGERFETGAAKWAARIATTRTVQEAWAAYLAWEDQNLAPDPEIHLAILSKLRGEDLRPSAPKEKSAFNEENTTWSPRWHLYPGDVREVFSPPPSTHLYTYTRSAPPTMHEFYELMPKDGMSPNARVYAFLVEHADTLKLGMTYLMNSGYGDHILRPLLDLDQRHDITQVPLPLYTAVIQLLCRFSSIPMNLSVPDAHDLTKPKRLFLGRAKRIDQIAIIHAIALLRRRRPLFRPAYNAVLQALGHNRSFQNLRSAESTTVPVYDEDIEKLSVEQRDDERLRGAITAHRLGLQVINLQRELHLDLDIDGFRAWCQIAENAALATWLILEDFVIRTGADGQSTPLLRDAVKFQEGIRAGSLRLKGEFRTLVGDDNKEVDVASRGFTDGDGTLLETPSFSLLHAYVRALGWIADHQGLLATIRWMRMRNSELATRQKQDRNGIIMMRRTLCALRVFLERSWLLPDDPVSSQEGENQQQVPVGPSPRSGDRAAESGGRPRPRLAKMLMLLRSPAPSEIIRGVREVVDSVGQWGGWPSDDEVERYIRSSKRFERVGGKTTI